MNRLRNLLSARSIRASMVAGDKKYMIGWREVELSERFVINSECYSKKL